MSVLGMNEVWVQNRVFSKGRSVAGVAEKNGEDVERRGRRFGAEEFGGPRLGGTPGPALKLCRNFFGGSLTWPCITVETVTWD